MKRASFKIEWDAHAYEHKIRTEDWFWAVGIIAVSVAVASVIFGNIIFGILILVAAFALSLFINRPPEIIHVVVDERGITKGHIRYPYATLHSFWLEEEHSHPKILLRSQKWFLPLIVVPLGEEVNTEKLEETLLQFLPREFHTVPWVERFLEYLGF
ncbi:hypothetical protein KW785_03320 [Candidatus Parcubacteria bacterium]|nr:hypothetical protein [Candidatus Parcubacteria bacterium]